MKGKETHNIVTENAIGKYRVGVRNVGERITGKQTHVGPCSEFINVKKSAEQPFPAYVGPKMHLFMGLFPALPRACAKKMRSEQMFRFP